MPLEVVDSAGPTGIVRAREFEKRARRWRARRKRRALSAACLLAFSSVRAEAQQASPASSSSPDAQSAKVRDAVFAEVTQAVLAMRTADSSIESSTAQARAADEAYGARRDLFRFGKGTSVELADAEANLFQARLAAVSARIDQRTARVRVDHATGRDVMRGMS
jgi:outer membrane protein TolC